METRWLEETPPCCWDGEVLLGGSGGDVNSLDFCPASLKSLGCFYFRCVLSSQWKVVAVNLQILHCQLQRHFWRPIVRMCLATSSNYKKKKIKWSSIETSQKKLLWAEKKNWLGRSIENRWPKNTPDRDLWKPSNFRTTVFEWTTAGFPFHDQYRGEVCFSL